MVCVAVPATLWLDLVPGSGSTLHYFRHLLNRLWKDDSFWYQWNVAVEHWNARGSHGEGH